MKKYQRQTILEYIPKTFKIEKEINTARIYEYNQKKVKTKTIIYLCEREMRTKDNFALQFALNKMKKYNLDFKIVFPRFQCSNLNKQDFLNKQLEFTKNSLENINITFFEIINPINYLLNNPPAILIIDFNPLLNRSWIKNLSSKVFEIDGHNIIPARFISNKQEYNAAIYRPKIYQNINSFLTEFDNITNFKTEADINLKEFINIKLDLYNEFKNDPIKNITSNLSKYINYGFISSQRIALEIIKSNALDINKESFLEELIVRKELSDNFCLYSKSYLDFSSIPKWAKTSLNLHKNDLREYCYSLSEFEKAKTHDKLWNYAQEQLLKTGKIHGYLRMYWAKKILEWSATPQKALKIAIHLNDTYALDSPSTNGYVGILWAIAGLHDRAFRDWKVSGKIRRMNCNILKKKLYFN